MQITVSSGVLTQIKTDALALPQSAIGPVDKALDGLVSKLIAQEQFKYKENEILTVHTGGRIAAQKVLVIGLGKPEEFSLETVRRVTGAVVTQAQKTGAKTLVCTLFSKDGAQAMAEGALLAVYKFNKYKTQDSEQITENIEQFTIITPAASVTQTKEAVARGETFAHATAFARDLVNEPPGTMTPKALAAVGAELQTQTPDYTIDVEIFDKIRLAAMGAGGILGIARGSDEDPYLIHLRYKPATRNSPPKKLALVGKGVTFDSGGLSIKPAGSMDDMKIDMAGAAAVLGVFSVLGRLQPNVEIHGIIAAVENLPSGKAIKPGDVVKTLSGKTVEVLNTDAEGRVILADALEYANRLQPAAIIDLATLTGACMVALGDRVAGLMSNNETLTDELRRAADAAGERIWPLPMPADYKEELKSEVADLSNIHQTRWGGAILGGMFLREFVKPETPWAHLDVAGPVFAKKPWSAYQPKGATGFGVRTLLNYVTSNNL